ncbi:MAG: hexokinase [Candidatus Omnitrophota bacterium]|jgi:hexokinase
MTDLGIFELPLNETRDIIKSFQLEMGRGLALKKSSLKMIPTYVTPPTGAEKGTFIALDLGGTNFRILELVLMGSGKTGASSNTMKFVIPKAHLTGSAESFFDFIAACLKKFLKKYQLESGEDLNLGFTFSFPVKQTGINSGRLVCWTKGFNVRGVVGNDVVSLFKKALQRKGVDNVKISALANDTVGTLAAKCYENPDCDIGVILGTGTNACYPEEASGGMIINTEWGNFNKLKSTSYDRELDKKSDRPGQQILEKMVSGMYLGRIAGLVIEDDLGLNVEFKTEYMSAIEADKTAGLSKTASVLKKAGIAKSTPEERRRIKEICQSVSRRGARISASCIAAIIKKMDRRLSRKHVVAIDGSVYEKHPTFAKNMRSCLDGIFGSKSALVRMVLAKDGSGKGAAVIAAVAASR